MPPHLISLQFLCPAPPPAPPQAEKGVVSAEKKRGKNTFAATYGVQDQATTLSWTNKPLKVGRLGLMLWGAGTHHAVTCWPEPAADAAKVSRAKEALQ